jgi:DNA-binding MarR family transcriptional regulator
MEIGKAIHQKQFRNPHQKAVINILYTSGWLTLEQTKFLRKHGLSPQQYNVLRILRGKFPEPATVAYIQDRMLDKMSNASRLVDKLVIKDLVARKPCIEDRRQVDTFITDAGLQLLSDIDIDMESDEQRFKNLSDNEAEMLSFLLDKVRGI